jgi:ankyrin repeat protein
MLLQMCFSSAAKNPQLVKDVLRIVANNMALFHKQLIIQGKSGELLLHIAIANQLTDTAISILNYAEYKPHLLSYFLETADSQGNTPLHLAVLNCLPELVKRILALVENNFPFKSQLLQAPNKQGRTALHCAALKNANKEAWHILASTHEEPQFQNNLLLLPDKNGHTPTHIALRENHSEVISAILSVIKCNFPTLTYILNEKRYDNCTLLQAAALRGFGRIVQSILHATADTIIFLKYQLFLQDSLGNTIAHTAAAMGDVEMLKVIVNSIESNPNDIQTLFLIQNNLGCTVYQTAALHNQEGVIEYIHTISACNLKFLQPQIMVRDRTRNILLHHVAILGHADALAAILNGFGKSPTFLELLTAANSNSVTAVHLAAAAAKKDVLKAIIKFMEDSNYSMGSHFLKRDNNGATALHLGVSSGNPETVAVILEYCDNNPKLHKQIMNKKDKFGRTPVDLAHTYGNPYIIALFPKAAAIYTEIPSGVHFSLSHSAFSSASTTHPEQPRAKLPRLQVACALTTLGADEYTAAHDSFREVQ